MSDLLTAWPATQLDREFAGPFWEGLSRQRLALPQCTSCNRYRWYAYPHCLCGDLAAGTEWTEVEGGLSLYSYTEIHHPFAPEFASVVPYTIGIVRVDSQKDVHLAGVLPDVDPARLRVGAAVTVTPFAPGGEALLAFALVGAER
jgi:uncharacterized OB-fold protein